MRIASIASRLALCGLLGMSAVAPSMAADGGYPSHPIQFIVPFSAGGQFDFLARLVAKSMSKNLGQSIIVENISGAGGNVGGAKAAAAKPDGYTLLEYGGNFAIAKYLSPKLSYDPVADLQPVAAISIAPHVILAGKSLAARTFKDLVAYLRQGQSGQAELWQSGGGNLHAADLRGNQAAFRLRGHADPLPGRQQHAQ